jgi:hypothetical protein
MINFPKARAQASAACALRSGPCGDRSAARPGTSQVSDVTGKTNRRCSMHNAQCTMVRQAGGRHQWSGAPLEVPPRMVRDTRRNKVSTVV